ncbi:hypothetical protein D1007_14055 [Hordeum vulgare]|nr:hypothetical protein D1007_14055 [Hordeum vulgare]
MASSLAPTPCLRGRNGRRRIPRSESDARHRIEWLAQSIILKEEGLIGLAFFGLRIREEPFPIGFTLPGDSTK